MWESDLIDSVFSSNPKKKSGKIKKKGKDSKSANSPNTPEKKVEPKIESGKTSDVADSKMKKKEFKDKDTEEVKTEANSASLKQHNSLPVTRNIPPQENQTHQVSDFSTDYSPPQEQWKQNDHHYDTRKHNRKDRGSKNIPQEAVSSFYQCDEEYSEPKYFNDIEDYHRSNSYNYYQDSNEYIQNHQYVDNNIGYYQQDQAMMHSQVDPTAQRQFE